VAEFTTSYKGQEYTKKNTHYKYHFHTLRHSYATYLLGKGVDLYTISNLLSHNQITTTQVYARISDTQRDKAIQQAFGLPMSARVMEVKQPQIDDRLLEIKKLELEVRKIELEKQI